MQYKFQILTTDGLIESTVDSNLDFSCAPFGYVPYRIISTCECKQNIINDFWRCVDIVLSNNNVTSEKYIRTIRAYSNGILYGESV
jgi:hypothetical protein